MVLDPDIVYTLGRSRDNLVLLPGQTVSRRHAEISWDKKHFVLRDLGSTNGMIVNGKQCFTHALFDGDHIEIGTLFLVYKEYDEKKSEEADFDRELTDTLMIEHQIAELLESVSERQVHEKIIRLKKTINNAKTKMNQLANRDRLTRLYNRRFFDEELQKEIERAKRYGYILSLFMIDIDHFKQVNDGHGHQKGDQVLAAVSSIIRKHTRVNDLVARYGGEEIAVVIPEMKSDNSVQIAEKIRFMVERDSEAKAGIPVTVSIGVSFHAGNDSPDRLIKKADKALYEAKRRGRNRVIVYNWK
ncbi:MAG: GGDEF domain-containing protein [Spirochaetales bacterium]|nr:GGDEF domain-containing protein [Spirochaetales bacterium]